MHPFFEDYLGRLTDLHKGCLKTIEDLSVDALDWIPVKMPTSDMNSINVLVTHLIGAERYWIGDVALGDISDRVRAEEFRANGLNADELAAKINAASIYARKALEKLKIDDLSKENIAPNQDRKFSIGWSLLHALEHTAIHLGHIQLTRQLWDEK